VKWTHLVVAGLTVATVTACGSSGGDGGSEDQFCDAARTAEAATNAQQALFELDVAPPPDKVQPAVEDFAAKFAAMTDVAPSEIKSDVATVNKAAQQLLVLVKANGFDVVTMMDTPEFTTLTDTFASPEYAEAQGRFEAYTQGICGVTTTPGG
jgi:spermidine/putrescine-binding protein